MRQTFNKWNRCFTYSRLPMIFIDNEFHILASNDAFRRKIGYSADDLLKMNFIDLIPEKIGHNNDFKRLIIEEKYHSFIISLGYFHKSQEVLKYHTCINNFYDSFGNYEESLVVLNPQRMDRKSLFYLN